MSWFESVSLKYPTAGSSLPPFPGQQRALAQLGAMSPLWMLFMGASTMGMAYWGMTRWMQLATPQKAGGTVVKLRLVKPAALPAAVPAPEIEQPAVEALKALEPEIAPTPPPAPEPAAALVESIAKPAAKTRPPRAAKVKAPAQTVTAEAVSAKKPVTSKAVARRKAPVRKPATKA